MKKASEYLKEFIKRFKLREHIALLVCIPVALIAILICLLSLGASAEQPPEQSGYSEPSASEIEPYPPTSPYSLEFQSLGDGTCLVMGIGSYRGSELIIPDESPEGDKVIGIGSRAFEGCGKLVSIEIPESVTSIGSAAFSYCSSLKTVTIKSKSITFRQYVFRYCTSLKSIKIPKNVKKIKNI